MTGDVPPGLAFAQFMRAAAVVSRAARRRLMLNASDPPVADGVRQFPLTSILVIARIVCDPSAPHESVYQTFRNSPDTRATSA